MNLGIQTLVNNLAVPFEVTIMFIIVTGSIIFFAKDFKLGTVMLMVISGLVFLWFYNMGYNYALPLVLFFISLVMLALTLYAVYRTTEEGTII